MTPGSEIQERIDEVAAALSQALGSGAQCIAVYGSAAGEEFSPGHSDVNLLIVLRDVTFADLRLIGATLAREARDLVFATPLVVTPSFLEGARDSFPIELADIAMRHRLLHGEDLLSAIRVNPARLREEAEREARSSLLRLRALVMHRPAEEEVRRALCGLVTAIALIERALLRQSLRASELRGEAVFDEVLRAQGISMTALRRVQALRAGRDPWPNGGDLDELLAATLREVEAVVAWVDAHAHDATAPAGRG